MSEHTPLPWVTDPFKLGCLGDVSTADGKECIAQTQQIRDDPRHTIRQANAAYIVRACNAFPEMLASLKFAYDELYDAHHSHMSAEEFETRFGEIRAVIEKAKSDGT